MIRIVVCVYPFCMKMSLVSGVRRVCAGEAIREIRRAAGQERKQSRWKK